MRIRLIALALLLCCSTVHAGGYAQEWQAGYQEGWRIESGNFSIPPIPPLPPLGHENDGFAEGVIAGAEAARAIRAPAEIAGDGGSDPRLREGRGDALRGRHPGWQTARAWLYRRLTTGRATGTS